MEWGQQSLNKWDGGLIVVYVLITALMAFAALTMKNTQIDYDAKVLQIQVDGKVVNEVALPVAEKQTIPIKTKRGYNLVVIEKDQVFIQEADCPDLICTHATPIHQIGDLLVCLPHKLVLEIKGRALKKIDVMAY